MGKKPKSKSGRLIGISPQLIVDDVISTAEFYRDTFGFHFDNFFGNPPVFVIVRRDNVQINFRQTLADKPGNSSNTHWVDGTYDIYLRVDNLDAYTAELQVNHAEILQPPITRSYQMRELVVRDCNGYVLCFGEEVEAAA